MSEIGSDGGSPRPIDFAATAQQDDENEPEQHSEHHSEAAEQQDDRAGSDAEEVAAANDDDPRDQNDNDDDDNLSDKDSDILSEVDEDQFDNFDSGPAPVTIDENITKTLKAAKRKRVDGDAPKRPKEGKRQKKRARSEEDDFGSGSGEPAARRPRKSRVAGERSRAAEKDDNGEVEDGGIDESTLTDEQRRALALDRAMDKAAKGKSSRRLKKKDEVDLEDELDEQIASLKVRMEEACVADNDAREKGRPAVHKLKLLPEVTAMLNRSSAQDNLLDPETNFLLATRYFLEPLNDGSLPAYNIQREIFTALTRMPIEKEALLSSGIGKVVLFYTRSKRPEVGIKRMAERLLGEWSRPILKRTDDYKKRHVETRDFDYNAAKLAQRQAALGSQFQLASRPADSQGGIRSRFDAERERALARESKSNRAQPAGLPATYTIAPRSTFDANRSGQPDHRPIGAGGLEAFRRMTQKNKGRRG